MRVGGLESDLGDIESAVRLALVAYRRSEDEEEVERCWREADVDGLLAASPWRRFRWAKGQKHYSGTYWCATSQRHVIYESRLELARLMFADFDTRVSHIVAQPFLLRTMLDGRMRRHVPDYLLWTETGPVVVDVKPRHRLTSPVVATTFSWTRAVVESRGWRYEVATEMPVVELENVRFLAGYRRERLVDGRLAQELRASDIDGLTFADAVETVNEPHTLLRTALMHLLWTQAFTVDMGRPLNAGTILTRRAL